MRRNALWASAAAILVIALAAPAHATGNIAISSVTSGTEATTVSGLVTFPDAGDPHSVGGFKTVGPAVEDVAGEAGLDLIDATIGPLPDDSGLRFTWHLSSLPAVVPPEGVRYTWALSIDGTVFQLQAKRTNIVSSTTAEDPVGHAQHLASGNDFFQLRGACQDTYLGTPIAGCYHLAFLEGGFDSDAGTVWIDVPYRTTDSLGRIVAPGFEPGVVIEAVETAGMSIAASPQVFVSNAPSSVYLNDWDPYFVGGQVHLAASDFGEPAPFAPYTDRAEVDGSSFTGTTVPVETGWTVYARGCNGAACVYASLVV